MASFNGVAQCLRSLLDTGGLFVATAATILLCAVVYLLIGMQIVFDAVRRKGGRRA